MARRLIAVLVGALASAAEPLAADEGTRDVHVFYNVFAKQCQHPDAARRKLYVGAANAKCGTATTIVKDQLTALRASPLWPHVAEIRFTTLGDEGIAKAVAERCALLGATCVHLGHAAAGDESSSLTPLHQFCEGNTGAAVAYIHDKGSFHDTPANKILRTALLRGLVSQPCSDAIVGGGAACDVCSMRFSPIPHQQTPGNMWLARCDYVARLREPLDFQRRMNELWPPGGPKVGAGLLLFEHWVRSHPRWPLASFASQVGQGRYAFEHWVHSHPAVKPCDVLDEDYHFGYGNLPPLDFNISFALAPQRWGARLVRSKNWGGWGNRDQWHAERWRAMLEEWTAIYGDVPPADSRLREYFLGP